MYFTLLVQRKNHMIISIEAEKAFDKIERQFMVKTQTKLGMEGNLLNLTKGIYKKPTGNIIVNGEEQNALTLRSKMRESCLFSLPFYIILEDLASAVKSRKITDWKRRNKTVPFFQITWLSIQKIPWNISKSYIINSLARLQDIRSTHKISEMLAVK